MTESMICWLCQQPIPDDELVEGNPCRLPSGEPLHLDCYLEVMQEMSDNHPARA